MFQRRKSEVAKIPVRKMLQERKYSYRIENVEKTKILLKYGKCYKNGNLKVTKIRKMLQKRKS